MANAHVLRILFVFMYIAASTFILETAIAQEEPTHEELEALKLQKEIELLDQQIISNNDYPAEIFRQGLALIGIAGGAAATAFFAWRRERKIPPTADQERILNEIATEWYSRSHLDAYNEAWRNIMKAEDQEKEVDIWWHHFCVKEFPTEFPESRKPLGSKKLFDSERVEKEMREYLNKRFHLKNDKQLERRIKIVKDASSVQYYHRVREILPSVAQMAVSAAMAEGNTKKEDYEKLVEESLRKLKRLMIFYRLREDREVIETLVRSIVASKFHH